MGFDRFQSGLTRQVYITKRKAKDAATSHTQVRFNKCMIIVVSCDKDQKFPHLINLRENNSEGNGRASNERYYSPLAACFYRNVTGLFGINRRSGLISTAGICGLPLEPRLPRLWPPTPGRQAHYSFLQEALDTVVHADDTRTRTNGTINNDKTQTCRTVSSSRC